MSSNAITHSVQRTASVTTDDQKVRIQYIDCSPPSGFEEKGTIVLFHGFPQTSYQFRHVLTPLAEAGYRVIAPDYRGAGGSSKPEHDFTKTTMAGDIFHLIHDTLNITGKVHLVGHDIGGMVAHAYASRFSEHVASIIWGECPLPGTSAFDSDFGTVQQFHFVFQAVPDLAVALVAGREEIYLKHFYDKLLFNSGAITKADLDEYVTAYSQPGALRCAFATYAAFDKDKEENRAWLAEHGKCKVPALVVSGDHSRQAEQAPDMVREVYEDVQVAEVKESGHYLAEESPQDFVEKVLGFVRKH